MDNKYLQLDYLIERAYTELKKEKKQKKAFVKPEILNHNRKSYISNFIKFCDSINREAEDVRKFINKDMNVDVAFINENNLDDNTNRSGLKFNTMYRQTHIMNCITNYMKQYVICEICKSGDTEIKKIDRINFMCCTSCKGQRAINP
jgi:translation initiation factor 2 beta subunit (eIF-2beta)/eIF-5